MVALEKRVEVVAAEGDRVDVPAANGTPSSPVGAQTRSRSASSLIAGEI